MAAKISTKQIVVQIQHFDTSLKDWLFDARSMSNYGQFLWQWGAHSPSRIVSLGGTVRFDMVPIAEDGQFQVIAFNPASEKTFSPLANVSPTKGFDTLLFLLTPNEVQTSQSGTSTTNSITGPGSSRTVTPTFKFSGSTGVFGVEAGGSSASTQTAPQSTSSVTTPGQATTVVEVIQLSLVRTLHLKDLAMVQMQHPVCFG